MDTTSAFAYSETFPDVSHAVLNTLYLSIACNHLHMLHLESGREVEIRAEPPFSNARLLVADFSLAERLLKQAVQTLLPKRFLRLSLAPRLLIQPLERLEGGLSMVEERILMELGLGSGARKVQLYIGDPLDADGVRAQLERPCA
ncbi:MAG: hypothetical protein KKC07_01210 [Gammaproteobacteria bacterium]|nr:hypothetical protein [Gammaproteobacteria bacterium]